MQIKSSDVIQHGRQLVNVFSRVKDARCFSALRTDVLVFVA